MTYQDIAGWSQVIAMAIFGLVMAGVLVYALRPGNKKKFDEAARMPLVNDEKDQDDREGGPNDRT